RTRPAFVRSKRVGQGKLRKPAAAIHKHTPYFAGEIDGTESMPTRWVGSIQDRREGGNRRFLQNWISDSSDTRGVGDPAPKWQASSKNASRLAARVLRSLRVPRRLGRAGSR